MDAFFDIINDVQNRASSAYNMYFHSYSYMYTTNSDHIASFINEHIIYRKCISKADLNIELQLILQNNSKTIKIQCNGNLVKFRGENFAHTYKLQTLNSDVSPLFEFEESFAPCMLLGLGKVEISHSNVYLCVFEIDNQYMNCICIGNKTRNSLKTFLFKQDFCNYLKQIKWLLLLSMYEQTYKFTINGSIEYVLSNDYLVKKIIAY